jgi:hypothetical protein
VDVQVVTAAGLRSRFVSYWKNGDLHREYRWHNGTKSYGDWFSKKTRRQSQPFSLQNISRNAY